jgi:hypothetical protein
VPRVTDFQYLYAVTDHTLAKVGVTNNPAQRLRAVRRVGLTCLEYLFQFPVGHNAAEVAATWNDHPSVGLHGLGIVDGHTEIGLLEALDEQLALIHDTCLQVGATRLA